MTPTRKPRTLDGWPIALTACILAVASYAYPPLSFWPVLGLLVLLVLTPAVGKR